MTLQVGRQVPDIEATYWQRGAVGPKYLALSDLRGKWVVLFFYTRDFTYVCPTELQAFAVLSQDFEDLGATVIGASTDSYFSHNAWFEQDKTLDGVNFPVIADTSHRISKTFGVLLDDGSALRGTFIIDPDGVLRHMSINEIDIGRNVGETLRLLQALQSGELCRAGWRPGQDEAPRYNEWLAQVFPRLKTSVLSEASQRLNTFIYDAGDIIIQQGAKSDLFYIVVSGEVSVIHRGENGVEIELAKLGPGEIFGEIGILTETRRSADVVADTEVTVLALDWDDFKSLVNQSDPTARDLMQIVEQRRTAFQK